MKKSSSKSGQPLLSDVAAAAGVTLATASRALSGAYGVHPETRKRVVELAAQLNYKPNRFARGLVTGRSNVAGLIVSDICNPYFAEVARGVEDAAFASGLDILLCNSDQDSTKQMRYVNSLMEKRVEGIIMSSVANLTREEQSYIAESGLPVVLIDCFVKRNSFFSTVSADNELGGELAAECLLAHGHRHIVHFSGPGKHGNLFMRASGFLRAVRQFGRGAEASVVHGAHTLAGGYEMAKKLFHKLGRITAISTANDAVAFGVIKAAIEMGVRIPKDVSLIGFDDVEVAALVHPPLTTIRQSKHEMGVAAIEILLRHSASKDHTPEHRLLGVTLVERFSVSTLSPRK